MDRNGINRIQMTLRQKLDYIFNAHLSADTLRLGDGREMAQDVMVLRALADSWNLDLVRQYAELKRLQIRKTPALTILPFGTIDGKDAGVETVCDDWSYLKLLLTSYVAALQEKGILVLGWVTNDSNRFSGPALWELVTSIGFDALLLGSEVEPHGNLDLAPLLFKEVVDDGQSVFLVYHPLTLLDPTWLGRQVILYEELETKLANHAISYSDFEAQVKGQIEIDLEAVDTLVTVIQTFEHQLDRLKERNRLTTNQDDVKTMVDMFFRRLVHESAVFYKREETVFHTFPKQTVIFVGQAFRSLTNDDVKPYFPACLGIFDEESIHNIVSKPHGVIYHIGPFSTIEQDLAFIKGFHEKGMKVIALVSSNISNTSDLIPFCDVILKADLFHRASLFGLLDVLTLKAPVTGRLARALLFEPNRRFYGVNDAQFKYKQVSVHLPAVTFSVTNPDGKDRFDVLQIYLVGESAEKKALVGFKKIHLRGKQTEKQEVILDFRHVGDERSAIELLTYHGNSVFHSLEKEETKKTKGEERRGVAFNHPFHFNVRFLYFNVPLFFLLLSIHQRLEYLVLTIAIILMVNYFLITLERGLAKVQKPITPVGDLIAVVDRIKPMEPKEILFDHRNKGGHSVFEDEDTLLVDEGTDQSEWRLKDYIKQLADYLEEQGLRVPIRLIRQWFASLMGSRLLIVQAPDQSQALSCLQYMAGYMGGTQFVEAGHQAFEALLRNEHSQLAACLRSAKNNPYRMHFMVFRDIHVPEAQHQFAELLNYLDDPYGWERIHRIGMAENIWYILLLEDMATSLPEKIVEPAFLLPMTLESIEPKGSNRQQPVPLSYFFFKDQFDEAKAHFFLNESVWKKFDQLDRYLWHHFRFRFTNRFIRQLEYYQTIYLLGDGEPDEVIDSLLAHKILPPIANRERKLNHDEESLLDLCDRLFGFERLDQSRALLTKIHSETVRVGDETL